MPLSRRDFLKVFGVTVAGAAAAPSMPPIPAGAPVAAVPAIADALDDLLDEPFDEVDLPDAMPHMMGDEVRAINRKQTTRLVGGQATIYLNGKRLERVIRFDLTMSTPMSEYIGSWGGYLGGFKNRTNATLCIEAFGQEAPIPLDIMQPVDIEIRHKEACSTVLQAYPTSISEGWGAGQLAVYALKFSAIGDVRMVQTVL